MARLDVDTRCLIGSSRCIIACFSAGRAHGRVLDFARMRVLAVETSARAGGVALVDGERLVAEYVLDVSVTHSERLLSAIDRVLAPGGSDDAANLVERFLGRPYGFQAFETWLSS